MQNYAFCLHNKHKHFKSFKKRIIMKLFTNFLQIIWKIWFLIIAAVLVIGFAPIIYLVVVFNRIYTFNKLKRLGANIVIFLMGFWVKIEGKAHIDYNKQYMLIANHTSVLDILLMIKIFKAPFVFVGKVELAKFPVFGYFYKKTNITVDRSSPKSKKEVYNQVENFTKKGLSVTIYPEGTIPDENVVLAPFKNGAFRMAIEHNLPILPMVFFDNKKHFPYRWTGGFPGRLRIKILAPIPTENLTQKDMPELRDFAYTSIYNELINEQMKGEFNKNG